MAFHVRHVCAEKKGVGLVVSPEEALPLSRELIWVMCSSVSTKSKRSILSALRDGVF